MRELLIVNYEPFHRERSQRPRNFEQFQDMVCADKKYTGKIKGIWELIQFNPKTREIIQRIWNMNAVTDQGANSMLQRAVNSSGATLPNLFNNLLITNNSGSTTLTAQIPSGTTGITSLAVNALPAAIPDGTKLILGFGGANQVVTVSNGGSAVAQGTTNIPVASFTASNTYAIGTNVVPQPQVTDNPNNAGLTANASSPLSQYSGNLSTGAFTYTPTSGTGNRTCLIQFEFDNATNGGSTTNGAYTDSWVVNVSSGATTNNYLAHEINNKMQVNDSNSILAKVTIKI